MATFNLYGAFGDLRPLLITHCLVLAKGYEVGQGFIIVLYWVKLGVVSVRLSLYWNGSLVIQGLIVLGNVLPFYNQFLLSAMENV